MSRKEPNYQEQIRQIKELLEKNIVLLPIFSSLAYLCSYFFEVAYLSVYNVPFQLAQIKLDNFVFVVAALILIITYGYIIYEEYKSGKLRIKSLRFLALVFLLLAAGILILPPPLSAAIILITVLLGALRWFAPKAFIKFFKNKRNQPVEKVSEPAFFLIIAALFLLCAISYATGRLWAYEQDYYATVQFADGKHAIIQNYSNKYLLVKVGNEGQIEGYKVTEIGVFKDKTIQNEKLEIAKFRWTKWREQIF
ncbi:hypothetical protein KY385_03285 [Candidatus Parcubacteria bacterium]|nr:hypothetical protein [Candidatus Parcubacteria bacterium]